MAILTILLHAGYPECFAVFHINIIATGVSSTLSLQL